MVQADSGGDRGPVEKAHVSRRIDCNRRRRTFVESCALDPSQSNATGAQVVRVTRRNIESVVKATGIIKPRVGAEVRVGSRSSGVVTRLYARIGDRVKKDQLLAELDDRDLTARRDEAAAAVQQADVNLELRQDRSSAQTGAQCGGRAGTERARPRRARRRCGGKAADGRSGEPRLRHDAAGLHTHRRADRGRCGVGLDSGGRDGRGELRGADVRDADRSGALEVWAYVDETDIGRIRVGQKARFTVDTYRDHEFDGRVTAVYPKAEIRDNVVNYVTVMRFEPPRDRTLRPEMTTTVLLAIDAASKCSRCRFAPSAGRRHAFVLRDVATPSNGGR